MISFKEKGDELEPLFGKHEMKDPCLNFFDEYEENYWTKEK